MPPGYQLGLRASAGPQGKLCQLLDEGRTLLGGHARLVLFLDLWRRSLAWLVLLEGDTHAGLHLSYLLVLRLNLLLQELVHGLVLGLLLLLPGGRAPLPRLRAVVVRAEAGLVDADDEVAAGERLRNLAADVNPLAIISGVVVLDFGWGVVGLNEAQDLVQDLADGRNGGDLFMS